MKIRTLTCTGSVKFRAWLETRKTGESPESAFFDGDETSSTEIEACIEPSKTFATRYDFGKYIVETLGPSKVGELLSRKYDGIWDWLVVAYFQQFGKKTSKYWHYVVTRHGHAGSLAYRHLARSSVEMYWRHAEHSRVMLDVDMSTWGDISEQLTSRQNVAYHKGVISTANTLYFDNGKLRRGAAGRVPPKSKRLAGDSRGKGGVARLALAVRRLSRTYDTHILSTNQMIEILPKEFSTFVSKNKV